QAFASLGDTPAGTANPEFSNAVAAIRALLTEYALADCAVALSIFELWLPNIASTVKFQLFAGLLASVAPQIRTGKKLTDDFDEFRNFCTKLIELCPPFSLLEDYVPEIEWGAVRYPHRDRLYPI